MGFKHLNMGFMHFDLAVFYCQIILISTLATYVLLLSFFTGFCLTLVGIIYQKVNFLHSVFGNILTPFYRTTHHNCKVKA